MIKAVAIAVYVVINLNAQISMIIDFSLKYICVNEVIIYDQSIAIVILHFIINEYQNLFIDQKITVDISENQ